ncbi:MAG: hypothetical protein CMK36_00250 [Porticoccaceae bacterium]|nr:hypothetical protein [Porticoccaceae bacterium]|tara:strand:+ start:747 stop:1283 length:537 start_codon:yes stop_codon:yes gene_type:complete
MVRLLTNGCIVIVITLLISLFAGCDLHEPEVKCEDQIKAYDKQDFVTDELGMAIDPKTGTRWFRCSGGKRFVNYRCQGEALYLSWDEATAYAKEFSEKSGIKWRLPTNQEMKSIIQPDCIAPAINTNVFLEAEVANHWTSSSSLHQDTFRCSLNTYSGRISCRQARVINQPFMLVRGR